MNLHLPIRTMIVLLAVFRPVLHAGELQNWNDTSYTIARTGRVQWTVQGTLRSFEPVDELYDRRIGAEIKTDLGGGVNATFAYLFRNLEVEQTRVFLNENRFTAGIAYPLVKGRWQVDGTTLYERHVVAVAADFNRYRQRFEVSEPGRRLSPWVLQDFTFLQSRGFVRSRSRAGVQWRINPSQSLIVAYQFESISYRSAWAPRHALYTEFRIGGPMWSWK